MPTARQRAQAAADQLVRGPAHIRNGEVRGGRDPVLLGRAARDRLVRGPARINNGVVEAPPKLIAVTGGHVVPNVNQIYPSDRSGVRRATPAESTPTVDVDRTVGRVRDAAPDLDLDLPTGPSVGKIAVVVGVIVAALLAVSSFAKGVGRGVAS